MTGIAPSAACPLTSATATATIRSGLTLTVPIFDGFFKSSKVREAKFLHRASTERLEGVERAVVRQTRDAFIGVSSEISRVAALRQAVASSRTALRASDAGYEIGTRTIVDVLDARRNLVQGPRPTTRAAATTSSSTCSISRARPGF